MYKEEVKQVIVEEWEAKYLNQEPDDYNYILTKEKQVFDEIEEVLSEGGMEGLGSDILQNTIDNVTKGISILNWYIGSLEYQFNDFD
ncbi:hypothetical protein, partial [Anaerosporobacter sp.]